MKDLMLCTEKILLNTQYLTQAIVLIGLLALNYLIAFWIYLIIAILINITQQNLIKKLEVKYG